MIKNLETWAQTRGYQVAWGDTSVIADIKKEHDKLRKAGELKEPFYADQMAWFKYPLVDTVTNPRSVILIAVPRPAHSLTFESEGGRIETVIPPTYRDYRVTKKTVFKDLVDNVIPPDVHADLLQAPLKGAAARLGLVTYGRNNITYTVDMGSYLQLVGLVTDFELPSPPERLPWKAVLSKECRRCRLCIQACPAAAIKEERFLLCVERCLVLYNENPGAWSRRLIPSLRRCFAEHRAIVGCLACQEVCPQNRGRLRIEPVGVSFTAGETEWLLSDKRGNSHGPANSILEKVKKIDMEGYYPILGRNLRELVKAVYAGNRACK